MKIIIQNIDSPQLQRSVRVRVALPDGYDTNKVYPLLLLHDGQEVFDLSMRCNYDWKINQVADNMGRDWVMVGIDCHPQSYSYRIDEYYPWHFTLPADSFSSKYPANRVYGGLADQYIDFVIHTVLTYVRQHYSITTDRNNIAMLGASMGAVVTMYMATQYPQYFGRLGIFSCAGWVDEDRFLTYCHNYDWNQFKIYLAVGGQEGSTHEAVDLSPIYLQHTQKIADLFAQQKVEYHYLVDPQGHHDAKSWRKYFVHLANQLLTNP